MTVSDRRTVLKGAAAVCGTCLLAACGGSSSEPSGDPGRNDAPAEGGLRASLTDVSDVPVGGAVTATAPDGDKVLITQPTEGEILAFSAICPHQGCTVQPDDGKLACPCHGSRFTLDGSVERGPAETSLRPYDVTIEDGRVLPA